jgi:hypothetical protein
MIEAYSASIQQTQCQLNLLDTTNNSITDYALAKRMSDTFAQTLNLNLKEHAGDWVGMPRLVDIGPTTIPGVQANNVVQNQQL